MTKITILGEVPSADYPRCEHVEIAILACGYESRARAFAQSLSFATASRFALRFDSQQVLGYFENVAAFEERGFQLVDVGDAEVRDWFTNILREKAVALAGGQLRVFIDISSQSRARLASLVEALVTFGAEMPLRAYFGYTIAGYDGGAVSETPNVSIGPVSPFFAGWTKDPDLPLSLVIGLGYEPDRALGAVEHLEPSAVWALLPHSSVSQYDKSLRNANAQLLQAIGYEQVLSYEVGDPNATIALLTALVARLAETSSVLLLPSGPKVLVILCLLLACTRRDIAVWRVSAGQDAEPVDRRPSGDRLIIDCVFTPEGK